MKNWTTKLDDKTGHDKARREKVDEKLYRRAVGACIDEYPDACMCTHASVLPTFGITIPLAHASRFYYLVYLL